MEKQHNGRGAPPPAWVPLRKSFFLIFRKKSIFAWSSTLVLLTVGLTWLGYHFSLDFIRDYAAPFTTTPPATDTILGWIKHKGWLAGTWLFNIVVHIVSFYAAFLLAYTITTPGYSFLSASAEKIYAGEYFDPDAKLTITGVIIDIFEGARIALLGILITIVALVVNFIPGIGQACVFLLYTYYSALMFIDYPASRRRWGLGKKLQWMRTHSSPAFRLGIGPALISMVPVVNIFAMALLFPLLTVHTTLNFSEIEISKKKNNLPQS